MIFNSIRWRLQAWHGLILITVLTGFGFTAYHVARDNQLRRIDQELEQHLVGMMRPQPPSHRFEHSSGPGPSGPIGHGGPADGLAGPERHAGPGGPGGPPPGEPHSGGHDDSADFFLNLLRESIQRTSSLDSSQTNAFYYVLWKHDGTQFALSSNAPPDVPMPERNHSIQMTATRVNATPVESGQSHPGPAPRSVTRTRGEYRELFRYFPHGECLVIGRSMAPDFAAMHRLALWLFAAGSGVLAVGLAGGWWLATRAIRPIEDISATAGKIAAGDLSQRINASDTESELGRLAGVLNSTFARLEAAFAHQVRFTSDASHELRTPISVILSQTQTALSRSRSAVEYKETLEACQRAAQRMRNLIESLLELARLDAGQQPMKREQFDLSRVARECVELVRPLAAERGVEIICELSAVQCLGDSVRLSQVLT